MVFLTEMYKVQIPPPPPTIKEKKTLKKNLKENCYVFSNCLNQFTPLSKSIAKEYNLKQHNISSK